MKEQELIELGFERADIEGVLYAPHWHYYTYDLGNGTFSLISNDDLDAEKSGWFVEVFEDESIRFTSKEDLEQLITLIKRNTIKK